MGLEQVFHRWDVDSKIPSELRPRSRVDSGGHTSFNRNALNSNSSHFSMGDRSDMVDNQTSFKISYCGVL